MGRISAVFEADGDETAGAYSISEWWLEPHTAGPGAHAHAEDDVFHVIEGTMGVLTRAAVLNVSVPGHFEKEMPAIAGWFAEHPPTDA